MKKYQQEVKSKKNIRKAYFLLAFLKATDGKEQDPDS
jgi:hypothetical protein